MGVESWSAVVGLYKARNSGYPMWLRTACLPLVKQRSPQRSIRVVLDNLVVHFVSCITMKV